MFYGSLPETSSVIHLTDTDKESLEAFLRYLYTDEIPDSPELTLKVMYLADKYMIKALVAECVEVIKAKLTVQNVCLVLTYAILIGEETLIDRGWQVVDSETRQVIQSESFYEIDVDLLRDFLKRDTLRITEIELFQAVLKWSGYKCEKSDLEVTMENRRSVLGDAIYNLRFLAMSQDEFLKEVVPTGLLSSEDSLAILRKFLGQSPPSLKWPVNKKRYDYLRYSRFDANLILAPTSTWRYLLALVQRIKFFGNPNPYFSWDYSRELKDCLRFQLVNSETKTVQSRQETPKLEAVMFHGVRVFGDAHGSEYHVTMTIKKENKYSISGSTVGVVSGSYTSEFARCDGYGFDVVLSKPIRIQLNSNWTSTVVQRIYSHPSPHSKKRLCVYQYPRSYTLQSDSYIIELLIKGPRSYYGTAGETAVKMCEHISVKFDGRSDYRDNGTDINRGQIFQLLLTPCEPCTACEETRCII
jgi:hypothetical protein